MADVNDVPETMAISMWQPWASLWCSPAKIHETRSWKTPFRGWLCVQAAVRPLHVHTITELWPVLDDAFGTRWSIDLPRGAVVGMVDVMDCRPVAEILAGQILAEDLACGNFDAGRFGWRRGEFRRFHTPIPCVGRQGFFRLPDPIARQVHDAVAAGAFVHG